MRSDKNKNVRVHRGRKPGFSLVATLLMLSLLMVLALGMTTLSAVTLKTSSRDKDRARARANARLALQIAIGELQRLAGPDQRVTAPSSAMGESARPHLTGVWEGWKWDGSGTAPDWDEEKKSRFKGWLVSTANKRSAMDQDYVLGEKKVRAVRMLPPNIADAKSAVDAEIVEINGGRGKGKSGFAWAVFDQSQKADISLPGEEKPDRGFARSLEDLSAAYEPGFGAVKARDWKVLGTRRGERNHVVSLNQSRLIGLKKDDASFHDAAAGSHGLLTDPVNGGFSTDLSTLFNDEKLPGAYSERFIYSGTDRPIAPVPTRFIGANPMASPDPSWALLHSHYNSYKRLSGENSPVYPVTFDSIEARPEASASASQLEHHPAFSEQQIAPVIAKAQFVFSLTFGVNPTTLNNMWSNGSARSVPASQRDNYITWLVIDPVITLWNPYNVPLRFNGGSIRLYRIPMAFRLYKNGLRLSDSYTRLTDAHTQADFKTRKNRYYFLKLLPEAGQSSLVMQPGEHVVFTGQEWTLHGSHNYNLKGLTMRPGFNPPAGLDSSPHIGGVTTQNLFVSSTGTSTGKDYGKTIRTVAVKGGDRIEVEVKPERAGADDLPETGGREVTGFLKYFVGNADLGEQKFVGGIELDYADKEKDLLPSYERNDMPSIIVNPAIPKTVPGGSAGDPEDVGADAALRWKEPFLIATFQQKTERDSRFPSRSWINNGPGNFYSVGGLDQPEDFAHQQYEFKWEPMTDWPPASPTIEISNERNRGYGGSGIYAQTGTEFAVHTSLPIGPAHSLGQFTHAPLNAGGQLPLVSHPFGNSFAPPLVAAERVFQNASGRTYLDQSYLANNALLDSNFLSTAADHPSGLGRTALKRKELLKEFFSGNRRLPNRRFEPYLGNESPDEITERLDADKDGHDHIAANLLLRGAFNVNSTSVAAWQALLASNFGADVPMADGSLSGGDGVPVVRSLPSVGGDNSSSGGGSDLAKWTGYRRLSEDQIESLAEAIVAQVKKRGPFQSLAEFVNRRPGGKDDTDRSGAVQAAIEEAGINSPFIDSEFNFTGNSGPNAKAGSGNTADGAPGLITQADILTPLLPQLVVRGDTFVVRACGEAVDGDGHRIRVWCEATVQRHAEFVDPTDAPTVEPSTKSNKTFGRRFEVISFRWLAPSEI